jgi:hypothetical protein
MCGDCIVKLNAFEKEQQAGKWEQFNNDIPVP